MDCCLLQIGLSIQKWIVGYKTQRFKNKVLKDRHCTIFANNI